MEETRDGMEVYFYHSKAGQDLRGKNGAKRPLICGL